jgi:hypothetical protein
MDQAEALRRHEAIWGQRSGETGEQWKVRVQSQKDEELKRNQEWEAEAKARAGSSKRMYRRSERSAYNSRGDFDPPGGWGAMGPDNG